MELSDVEEPKYAKASRTKKKAWPVGANGLRKKRVVKSREYTDSKGFMGELVIQAYTVHFTSSPIYVAIEDYSEYESVNSESEQPPEPSSKPKKSAKNTDSQATSKGAAENKPAASTLKKSSSSKPKQEGSTTTARGKKKTLDSFFQKK